MSHLVDSSYVNRGKEEKDRKEINIRPASSVYATYQRLSYKPWYALAEFVDNSSASYLSRRSELLASYRRSPLARRCRIEIQYDHTEKRLTIWDNAYGMELDDFQRAIVLDQPPANRGGRNEFGMGLKTAACWFGTRWTVETTQLGSTTLYRATIDVKELAKTRAENITYTAKKANPDHHWTRITIEDVQQPIVKRAHGRVKAQLASIYRNDLRSGEVEIIYQGEPLTYEAPVLLEEMTSNGIKLWRKELNFKVPWERKGTELEVTGWVGIQKVMTRRDSGFVLMRRGRVIVGGPEEGYRPQEVVGMSNTHEHGRIVGELNMDKWPVNQAKDGFSWNDGLEDALIDALKTECREVVQKARTYRVKDVDPAERVAPSDMLAAAEPIQQITQDPKFQRSIRAELPEVGVTIPSAAMPSSSPQPQSTPIPPTPPTPAALAKNDVNDVETLVGENSEPISYQLDLGASRWLLQLFWQQEHADTPWMSLRMPRATRENEPDGFQVIEIYLNMAHPFLAPYLSSRASLDLLQRLVFGLSLSETMVRAQAVSGKVDAGAVRTKMNDILKFAAQAEEDR